MRYTVRPDATAQWMSRIAAQWDTRLAAIKRRAETDTEPGETVTGSATIRARNVEIKP
ncbi:MAG TPA: hypothetical protein VGJ13_01495 [Pseudonocardiaceae bacterium]|jgi:hypothetical protein